MSHERFVITHPDWGIYLGNFLGLGFFSMLDSGGQKEACVFRDRNDAEAYVSTWAANNDVDDYVYIPVSTQHAQYATIDELRVAGLCEWLGDMVATHDGVQQAQ